MIGHRNPDTDSVVSAIAYAYLKRQQGLDCLPARAGRLTPQTEYVLKRFGVPFPAFVPDLQPKVRHFLEGEAVTLPETASLWQALGLMDSKGLSVLPVTDGDGRYRSMLNHLSFARNMTRKINPKRVDQCTPLFRQTLCVGKQLNEPCQNIILGYPLR